MADPQEIAKWRRAHQNISVPDEGLATVAPFPSLYAGDFAVYLEARGFAAEMVRFVSDMTREIAWVYDNWASAQHRGDPKRLIEDMLNGATSQGEADYSMVRKYIRDYAKANGIALAGEQSETPSWMGALGPAGGVAEGTGGDTPVATQPRPLGGLTSPPPALEAADAVPDR